MINFESMVFINVRQI